MEKYDTDLRFWKFLTKQQVADHLQVSESSIDLYRKQGKIKGKNIGGKIMFLEREIIRYIKDADWFHLLKSH